MSDKTYFCDLTEEHVEQCADVIARSFLNMNQIWKKNGVTYEEVYPVIRAKVLPAVKNHWSYVLIKDNKVIGATIQYDVVDYLKLPSMPYQLELFNKLGKAGKQLQKNLNFASFKRGQAFYGPYAVIDPNQARGGHSLKFWLNTFFRGKVTGMKYYYSRLSSPISLKILQKIGAQVLGQVEIEGTNEKNWMVRVDLQKPFPSYSQFVALSKMKQPKASL